MSSYKSIYTHIILNKKTASVNTFVLINWILGKKDYEWTKLLQF